ncbi:MAG: hypothetical protein IPJ06_19720 [Saprospiraceae bacterium]|nr:hypothetical protein [Saprospiraceae bacterium]
MHTLSHDATCSHTYKVKANWALYVENYLEGLHIPFVHPALREALDLTAYPLDIRGQTVLQTGLARRTSRPLICHMAILMQETVFMLGTSGCFPTLCSTFIHGHFPEPWFNQQALSGLGSNS